MGNNFSYKTLATFWPILINATFYVKYDVVTQGNLGYFLFKHLVTLNVSVLQAITVDDYNQHFNIIDTTLLWAMSRRQFHKEIIEQSNYSVMKLCSLIG